LLGRNLSRFEIRATRNKHYMFVLKGANGQIILTSEHYTSKAACMQGIEDVRQLAGTAGTLSEAN
jgi:uncharacterized protein YegP (UPF0339 family)